MPSTIETPPKSKSLLELLPGNLPHAKVPPNTNLEAAADHVLKSFPHIDKRHFTPDAIWRDTYALTGTIRTFYFEDAAAEWSALSNSHGVSSVSLVPGSVKVLSLGGGVEWVDCKFTFYTTTPATECSGMLSLVPSPDGSWKIWVLRTILEQLSNHGNVDSMEPANVLLNGNGAIGNHSYSIGTANQDDSLNGLPNGTTADQSHRHFDAVIIGGGQSGLSTGGRLQALGVSYVIIEKNAQVGDAWGLRYESARLHTVREYSHLPFDRAFGSEYGEYLGKDELAKGHKKWAEKYGINIWLSTNVTSGSWNEDTRTYTLDIVKEGRLMQISTRHVVIATGAGSQTPVFPNISNKDSFKGILLHSADYSNAQAWAGRTGIVIGTANTAHDVADDMYEAGMKVTMVQRSRTFVLPAEFIKERYDLIYNAQIPTEVSDRAMFTPPVSIARLLSFKTFHAMARSQPERYEALERAGFRVDPFGDIQDAINIRLGGHYIDVGTSAKIGKGLIKVKSDATAERYTEHGLAFTDGTEIKADVIVLATGFVGNLRQHVDKIFGSAIAKRAGDCYGLDGEGEVLGAYKPLEQPGLWYIGGSLGTARYFSRFIALSIKADVLGQPLPVYREHKFRIEHRIRRRQFDEVRDFMNLASRSSTSASPPSFRSMTLSQSNDQNRNRAGENEVEPVDANSTSHYSFAAPQIMPIPALNSEPSLAEERVRHLEATLQTIAKLSSRSVANSVGSCTRLSMYLPKVEYNDINSKVIQPVLMAEVGVGSLLIESTDFLLYSQLYIIMSLGRCLQSREDPGRDTSEAASFYDQSMSLINDVPSIPTHWVGMARFHFFRAIYLMQADDLQAAGQAISAPLQYAWQSKLNDQSVWPSCNPRESLSRKRLWWAIYCMERRLCQKIGKPSGICDKEVAVDDLVSKEQLVVCQDLDVLPEQISQDDLHLQILVDISRLWGKVWDKFFRAGSHTSNSDEEVDMMSLRISHLHRNVPAIFQWSNSTLDNLVEGSELDLHTSRRLVIHVRYTLLRLLVRQNPTRTEPVNIEQARFCHMLVSEVVDTLSKLIAVYSIPRIASLAYFIASALTECSYHVAAVLHNPICKAERLPALRTMKKLIESLKLLSPSVKAAQRAYSILHPQAMSAFQSFMNCGETSDGSNAPVQFQETGVEAYLQSMFESWPGLPLASPCLPQSFEGCSAILNEIEIASSDHLRFETSSGGAALGLPFSADGAANATDMDELSFPYLYFG
ncbi:hypothetical protein ACKAV7_015171 [Fusarium commune]